MNKLRPISLFTFLTFLLSSVAIVAAARGDLWLDEIWSLSFAREAESIADVFLRFHHDNNHPLNTLFLYCVGDQKVLIVYRLFSVFSGLGSLLIAGYVAKRDWGDTEALCTMVLMGTCYPLLLYFSEARGYAAAILFGLAAYATLGLTSVRRSRVQHVLFWTASVLGILSHATFVILFFALILWSVAQEIQAGDHWRAARRLLFLHAPPLLFFAWWYVFFLKGMAIGAGPVLDTWDVIGYASVLILGLPDIPVLRVVATVLVLLLVGLGSTLLSLQRDMRWIFFPAVLVISPALILLVTSPKYLYFRYFILCFPFFILLLAYLVGRCCQCSPKLWRWMAFTALAALLVGQAPRNYLLLKLGRGQYSAALKFIAKQSSSRTLLIGSDHDFRNKIVVDFYAPYVDRGGNLRYVNQPQWRSNPPDWILVHSFDVSGVPGRRAEVQGVGDYLLTKEYKFSGISGWRWLLFRREMDDGRRAQPTGSSKPDAGDG